MKKRIRSFGYAGKGIRMVFSTEPNMRIHILIAILVTFFGVILSISITEWMLCILCFGLVISAEMINTAFENIVDLVSPEKNEIAGKVKDIAAGAVLVCAIISAIVGLIIFIPKGLSFIIQ
ncbi:MAG: diacylglycerol kinase family protein [Paludibacter sp.]|nr:diacylglycerol kinase family protein [Paludibacter sp.]